MDPACELAVCGSSNYGMSTFGEWEETVLEAAYDAVEYISLHQYYYNPDGDTPTYLAKPLEMDRYIKTVAAICDYVKGRKRSDKSVYLSFDEYNVWNLKNKSGNEEGLWQVAPRREEFTYSMEDALVFGGMLLTLIKNCDRVKIACQAQLVNVGGMIMTRNNGPAWVQTIYYPFVHAARYGRGTALMTKVNCDTYESKKFGKVPVLDCAAVLSEDGRSLTVFAINRSMEHDVNLEISLRDFEDFDPEEHIVLKSEDLDACNTAEDPTRVRPQSNGETCIRTSKAVSRLDRLSWNVIRFSKREGRQQRS